MRLDLALVERGLARSRSRARRMIDSGSVLVDGRAVSRPAYEVTTGHRLTLAVPDDRYVSRAAGKLIGALDDLEVPVSGRVLDAGASTGGFTQVLLERGCRPVYAVDVGHDQLDPLLRADERVVVRERTNLRDLVLDDVGGQPVDLLVADVSFISLRLLLDPLLTVLDPDGVALLMVKPQFEVGRSRLGKGGVVRSADLRTEAVDSVAAATAAHGWVEVARAESRLPGPAGNVEYFLHLRHG
ncbi:MAG: TlyA family RNA methyltransferase [Propionibacteriaceae bacterium]